MSNLRFVLSLPLALIVANSVAWSQGTVVPGAMEPTLKVDFRGSAFPGGLQFSQDGSTIWIKSLEAWNVDTGEKVLHPSLSDKRIPTPVIDIEKKLMLIASRNRCEISPDGNLLAGRDDGEVKIWDVNLQEMRAVLVTQDGNPVESLSGSVESVGEVDLNSRGAGVFEVTLTATDENGAETSVQRIVNVSDDDTDGPGIAITGSSGTELEIDTNEYAWSVTDVSGLSSLSVTVTLDQGDGPEVVYSTTDVDDAVGAFNYDDLGTGIYEILIVATDADGDWAGDGASANAGRTSVVGELFLSTSTRAKLHTADGEWVNVHRADIVSANNGDILFDHSQLSHPWFSWWTPNLDAFHMLADGSMILSTNGRGSIGGQDFRDGGLVRFFGDEWLARNADNPGQLHQTAQMIITEQQLFGETSLFTGIDAISIAPDGNLIVSLDRGRKLADGKSYHRGDLIKLVVREDGALDSSSIYFDHQVLDAVGLSWFGRLFDRGVNVDGAHVMEDGRILLSVGSTASVGDSGPHFKDGDIFVYDPADGSTDVLFDEDDFRRNEDVDAVFLGVGNGELNLLDS